MRRERAKCDTYNNLAVISLRAEAVGGVRAHGAWLADQLRVVTLPPRPESLRAYQGCSPRVALRGFLRLNSRKRLARVCSISAVDDQSEIICIFFTSNGFPVRREP